MKNLILILSLVILGPALLTAQKTFNCGHHQFCYWSTGAMNFENCKGFDENSTFVMSKDEKSLTYQLENLINTYSVYETEYKKEYDISIYYATSADGSKFVFTFDPRNKQISFVSGKDEKTILQIFKVK